MVINKWFDKGCNYKEGVLLYSSLKDHSSNLLRLFLRKESAQNIDKLKYELGKRRLKLNYNLSKKKTLITLNPAPKFSKKVVELNKISSFYRLNELHQDLHKISIQQRTDFQTAISLHNKLINLHDFESGEALRCCILIEELFDAIETTQKILDHYVNHKVVLNIKERTYQDYTGGQLADARRNKRSSVAKYKKRVIKINDDLGKELSKSQKTKLKISLEKASTKLLLHEVDLQQLNDLINDR